MSAPYLSTYSKTNDVAKTASALLTTIETNRCRLNTRIIRSEVFDKSTGRAFARIRDDYTVKSAMLRPHASQTNL